MKTKKSKDTKTPLEERLENFIKKKKEENSALTNLLNKLEENAVINNKSKEKN